MNDSTNIGMPKISDPTTEIPLLSQNDTDTISKLPKNHALLLSFRAYSSERYLLKTDKVALGRDDEADILLDDPSVSREHAVIKRENNDFFIEDAGSLNGTYVNRGIIENKYKLERGDEIQIGKYRLLFFPSPQVQN